MRPLLDVTISRVLAAYMQRITQLGSDMMSHPPGDDSGSETLARYDYQINLTTFACLGLLLDDGPDAVVCEWAEDYVIVSGDKRELVSVKHLEPSQGAWSLAKLCVDGGLAHLFDRWLSDGRRAKCRLQTNGGMKTGREEAEAIRQACSDDMEAERVGALIYQRLGAETAGVAAEFLRNLTIDCELPKRDDLPAKLLHEDVPRICLDLGWRVEDAQSGFEIVKREVEAACRADIRAERRALILKNDGEEAHARALAKKTINRERIEQALVAGNSMVGASMLVTKLTLGGFGQTAIERGKRLRSEWLAEEFELDSGLPGGSSTVHVRSEVQRIADIAEARTRNVTTDEYGPQMRDELLGLAESEGVSVLGEELTEDQILGIVYDETDLCHVWWSEKPPWFGVA